MISDGGTENSINETIPETKGPTEDNNKKRVAESMDNGDADERLR